MALTLFLLSCRFFKEQVALRVIVQLMLLYLYILDKFEKTADKNIKYLWINLKHFMVTFSSWNGNLFMNRKKISIFSKFSKVFQLFIHQIYIYIYRSDIFLYLRLIWIRCFLFLSEILECENIHEIPIFSETTKSFDVMSYWAIDVMRIGPCVAKTVNTI